jgi:InsA N-terminal domain
MPCPGCQSAVVTKDGTTPLGGQRFRCRSCGRRFTRRSGSAFSGRAFADDIITLAVRWYVRYRVRRGQRVVGRARHPRRSEHDLSMGPAVPAAVRGGRPAVSGTSEPGLACRQDLHAHPRPLALHLPRHRCIWPDRRRVRVAHAGHGRGPRVLRGGHRLRRHDTTAGHHRQGGAPIHRLSRWSCPGSSTGPAATARTGSNATMAFSRSGCGRCAASSRSRRRRSSHAAMR